MPWKGNRYIPGKTIGKENTEEERALRLTEQAEIAKQMNRVQVTPATSVTLSEPVLTKAEDIEPDATATTTAKRERRKNRKKAQIEGAED